MNTRGRINIYEWITPILAQDPRELMGLPERKSMYGIFTFKICSCHFHWRKHEVSGVKSDQIMLLSDHLILNTGSWNLQSWKILQIWPIFNLQEKMWRAPLIHVQPSYHVSLDK